MKRLALAALIAVALWPTTIHASTGVDYAVTGWTGPATVAQNDTFTRTLTVTNIGDTGGTWPANLIVYGIQHATFVTVTGATFQRCGLYKFTSGAPNYAKCWNTYLHPGESATMTVTYRAPAGGWVGYVYGGGGRVEKTSMELEANTANNYTGVTVGTTVVP